MRRRRRVTIYDDDEDLPLAVDAAYNRALARVGAIVGCLTLVTFGLLSTIAYHSWTLAHAAYF